MKSPVCDATYCILCLPPTLNPKLNLTNTVNTFTEVTVTFKLASTSLWAVLFKYIYICYLCFAGLIAKITVCYSVYQSAIKLNSLTQAFKPWWGCLMNHCKRKKLMMSFQKITSTFSCTVSLQTLPKTQHTAMGKKKKKKGEKSMQKIPSH